MQTSVAHLPSLRDLYPRRRRARGATRQAHRVEGRLRRRHHPDEPARREATADIKRFENSNG